jgi:tripartite-type tricarboxylate transporter receptor subunit TctC
LVSPSSTINSLRFAAGTLADSGAGTNIAVKSVITAEPDGHTLLMAANALAANMALYQPAPFDAEKELVAISLIGRVPVVIAANPNMPYATVKQLIEAAKGKHLNTLQAAAMAWLPEAPRIRRAAMAAP